MGECTIFVVGQFKIAFSLKLKIMRKPIGKCWFQVGNYNPDNIWLLLTLIWVNSVVRNTRPCLQVSTNPPCLRWSSCLGLGYSRYSFTKSPRLVNFRIDWESLQTKFFVWKFQTSKVISEKLNQIYKNAYLNI